MLGQEFLDRAINEGANIFFPTTGSNRRKLINIIKKLKDNGYEIDTSYIDIEPKENIIRTITRGITTGRYTNPEVIGGSYKGVKDFFLNQLTKSDLIDNWELWDNNKKATLIDKGGK